jgi:isocitrate/isopropylmalate dehydrogenase
MYARDYDVAPKLVNLHRVIVHMVHVVLPRLMSPEFSEESNRDLRIKYLLGAMDKTTWKRVLYQREKKREKDVAIRQALEVFINVAAEALWKLTDSLEEDDEINAIRELDVLRRYTNECLMGIQKRFNSNRLMTIDSQFIFYTA